MENFKIKVKNEEHSRKIQELCLKNGITWVDEGATISYCSKTYLYIAYNKLLHGVMRDVFEEDPSKEVTLEELEELFSGQKNIDNKPSLQAILNGVTELVLHKDKQYGNSANNPLNIFGSKCKYGYRLDEKLSRVQNSETIRKNDAVDLIGALLLVCQEFGWDDFSEFKD